MVSRIAVGRVGPIASLGRSAPPIVGLGSFRIGSGVLERFVRLWNVRTFRLFLLLAPALRYSKIRFQLLLTWVRRMISA